MTALHSIWLVLAVVGSAIFTIFYTHARDAAKDEPIEPLEPVQAPTEPPVAPVSPPEPPIDRIRACALAQQSFEGYFPGSSSQRHLNPGNCKDSQGNFLTFKTYEAGFAYLEDYIRRVAIGQHKAYPKGGDTLLKEYVHIYTADGEPSWTNYIAAISRATGLSPESKMSELLT